MENLQIWFCMFLVVVGASAESCVQCSSANNTLCATSPANMMARNCAVSNSTCYTMIYNGLTVRGCTSDLNSTVLQTCYMNQTCQTCNRTACNNAIFPQSRPTCYQCNNQSTPNCTQVSYSIASPCPIYREDDRCFIYSSTKYNSFIRGCMTSSSNLCANASQCYLCNGHGCNDLPGNNTLIPNANGSAWRTIGSSFTFLLIGLFLMNVA